MKILRALFLVALIFFFGVTTALASGVTFTPTQKGLRGEYAVYLFAWDMTEDSTAPKSGTSETVTGEIVGVKFEPISGATAYPVGTDVLLLDAQGNDIFQGIGSNIDPAAGITNYRTPLNTDGERIHLVNELVGLDVSTDSGVSSEGVVKVIAKR